MNASLLVLVLALLLGWSPHLSAETQQVFGTVRDAVSGAPLAGTEIRAMDSRTRTAADGAFSLETEDTTLVVRRPGYRPRRVSAELPGSLTLQPLTPRALYLSYWAADSRQRRRQLQQLLERTGMNALVIDLKSARGDVAFRSRIPLARAVGAQKVRTLKDLPEFLAELKAQGIYTIGRIAVFKDDALARQRRKLAVHTLDGYLWTDRDGISWVDPYSREVWDYNIALAREAAKLGFDEIQFDYIRFPARSDLLFSKENLERQRVAAINGFLRRARTRLGDLPVMLSANVFGYICWKHRDRKIGQRLLDLADSVDYLSPMLYPSGFAQGIPGYRDPVAHSAQVVARSLDRARELTGLEALRFRPWLQAFRDYAFDRRRFTAEEIHAQINASEASGSNGWMLWNAASRFSLAGLQQKVAVDDLHLQDVAPKVEKAAMVTDIRRLDPDQPLL